jgi:hypothetical protein
MANCRLTGDWRAAGKPAAARPYEFDMERARAKLEALHALWQETRRAPPIPSRSDMPVSALPPWPGNLALIDPTGAVPYIRLCGSNLRDRFGAEVTGCKLDSLSEAHGRCQLHSCIEQVRQALTPVQAVYELPRGDNRTVLHELCLRLGHDERKPTPCCSQVCGAKHEI